LPIDRWHLKLSAESGFGKTDFRIIENIVSVTFERLVRLQSYPNIEISTAPSLSSVPFSPDSKALAFVSSGGNFHLEFGPSFRKPASAAVLTWLVNDASFSSTFGARGYLDELGKASSTHSLDLASATTITTGLPRASRLGPGPVAFLALCKPGNLYLPRRSTRDLVETNLSIVDQVFSS